MAGDQVARTEVGGGVRQSLGGQKSAPREPLQDGTKLLHVRDGGHGGPHARGEVRQILVIATLRKVQLVTYPTHSALHNLEHEDIMMMANFEVV